MVLSAGNVEFSGSSQLPAHTIPLYEQLLFDFLSLGGTRYDARASQPLWAGLFDFEHKPQQTMNESAFQCFFFFFSQN